MIHTYDFLMFFFSPDFSLMIVLRFLCDFLVIFLWSTSDVQMLFVPSWFTWLVYPNHYSACFLMLLGFVFFLAIYCACSFAPQCSAHILLVALWWIVGSFSHTSNMVCVHNWLSLSNGVNSKYLLWKTLAVTLLYSGKWVTVVFKQWSVMKPK